MGRPGLPIIPSFRFWPVPGLRGLLGNLYILLCYQTLLTIKRLAKTSLLTYASKQASPEASFLPSTLYICLLAKARVLAGSMAEMSLPTYILWPRISYPLVGPLLDIAEVTLVASPG